MTSRNVSAGTLATGVAARKKSSSANPAITTKTGAPRRNEAKRSSDPSHARGAVWPWSNVGPSGMTRNGCPYCAAMRETTKGMAAAASAQATQRPALVGAAWAPR